MKRHCETEQSAAASPLPMEIWGEVVMWLADATSVLNLSVLCRSFYTDLEPAITVWLRRHVNRDDPDQGAVYLFRTEITASLCPALVHEILYHSHLAHLYTSHLQVANVCVVANRGDTASHCWYVDPVQRRAAPLLEMNPLWVQFDTRSATKARDTLEKQKPPLWNFLSHHLWCHSDGWRDVVWHIMGATGTEIGQRPAVKTDLLNDHLVLDDQLICQMGEPSPQCLILDHAKSRHRMDNERIVIKTYLAEWCYTRAYERFMRLC